MIKNYYQILDICQASSQNEIKSAFRKLAIFWHPDKNGNPIALEKMKELNEAYSILSDVEKRKVYDTLYNVFFANTQLQRTDKSGSNFEQEKSNFNEENLNTSSNYEPFTGQNLNKLNNWIANIKFSLKSLEDNFNLLREKGVDAIDKPLETIAYYAPIILILVIVLFIAFLSFKFG